MNENTPTVITDPHHVQPVFVNMAVGIGHVNGVFNLSFATALFSPRGDAVDPDFVVSSRLRMDSVCLQQLYEQIGNFIASQKPVDERPN